MMACFKIQGSIKKTWMHIYKYCISCLLCFIDLSVAESDRDIESDLESTKLDMLVEQKIQEILKRVNLNAGICMERKSPQYTYEIV